jgi:hypothetical protein
MISSANSMHKALSKFRGARNFRRGLIRILLSQIRPDAAMYQEKAEPPTKTRVSQSCPELKSWGLPGAATDARGAGITHGNGGVAAAQERGMPIMHFCLEPERSGYNGRTLKQ